MELHLFAPIRSEKERAVARRRALVKATLACFIALLGIAAARALSGETIGPRVSPVAISPIDVGVFDYFPHRYESQATAVEEPVATF